MASEACATPYVIKEAGVVSLLAVDVAILGSIQMYRDAGQTLI